MAKRRRQLQGAGTALVALGAGLAVWGYRDSQSVAHRVADALGSGVSQEVLVLYLAGAACLAVGVFLIFRD